jgi:hypothetical protein
MSKNRKKIYSCKTFFLSFGSKIAIYLSLRLHKGLKPSALKREHPALQNMKILYFFLYLWVIFALLDSDTATQINADPESGSTTC